MLASDLIAAYISRCAGRTPDWAELLVQYIDYTLWQRDNLGDLTDRESPTSRPPTANPPTDNHTHERRVV